MKITNVEQTNETERYAEFGRAATIPGIQMAIDTLQKLLDDIKIQLAAAQGREALPTVKHRTAKRAAALAEVLTKRGKPYKMHPRDPNHPGHAAWVAKIQGVKKKNNSGGGSGIKGYWAAMTPEERSAEMVRRVKVRAKKRLVKVALKKEAAA